MDASDLVPGDIISVAVGDRVPADCRLLAISSSSFRVDQALLTGESESVSKTTEVIKDEKAVKQDMQNMIFSVSSFFFIQTLSLPCSGYNGRQRTGYSYCREHRIQHSDRRYPFLHSLPEFSKDTSQAEIRRLWRHAC